MLKTYLLRSIPETLWVDVRTKAKEDQRNVRSVMIYLLKHYTDGSILITGATGSAESDYHIRLGGVNR